MYNPAQAFDTYQPPPDLAEYFEPSDPYEPVAPQMPVRGGGSGRVDTRIPMPVRGGGSGRVDTRAPAPAATPPADEPNWGIARTTRLPEGEPLPAPATRMLTQDEDDMRVSVRQEYDQVSGEVRELRLVLRQSQQEQSKLSVKKTESAAQVAEIEEQIQMYPREQIRDAYVANAEAEMRWFMMSEQVDNIKSKLSAFERYERFLQRTLDLLQRLPMEAAAPSPRPSTPLPSAPLAPVASAPEATAPAAASQPPVEQQSAVRFDLHYGEGVPVEAPNYDLELVETRMLTPEPKSSVPAQVDELADSLETRQALQQAATVRVVRAEEQVRSRVSEHLHARILQPLVTLALSTDICANVVDADPPAARAELTHVRELLQSTLHEATETMLDLRPIFDAGEGLAATIQRYATALGAAYGASVEVAVPYGERELAPEVSLAVFRVAQEALRNAILHGQAHHIEVVLSFVTDGLMVVIEDDGAGFEVDETLMRAANHETSGIMSMLERAEMLGGMLRLNSTPGQGTRVELGAPL